MVTSVRKNNTPVGEVKLDPRHRRARSLRIRIQNILSGRSSIQTFFWQLADG